MKNVVVSWSSGKDSALSLYKVLQSKHHNVVGLFTTYSEESASVPIQATPIKFVRLQAQAMGLPLLEIPMQPEVSNEEYKNTLLTALQSWSLDFDAIAFGDLFQNGIVEFRQRLFSDSKLECLFPIMIDSIDQSIDIAKEIVESDIQAFLQSVNLKSLDQCFCGEVYNHALLDKLPSTVDPCGEFGEFHSYVYDAPFFNKKINIKFLEQELQHYYHGSEMPMMVQKFDAWLS